jgi:hypothetical protein
MIMSVWNTKIKDLKLNEKKKQRKKPIFEDEEEPTTFLQRLMKRPFLIALPFAILILIVISFCSIPNEPAHTPIRTQEEISQTPQQGGYTPEYTVDEVLAVNNVFINLMPIIVLVAVLGFIIGIALKIITVFK